MTGLLLFSGLGLYLAGVGLLLLHAFQWAKYGVWVTYKTILVPYWLGLEWATEPTSWLGIHQALSYLPLWACCLLLGTLVAFAAGLNDQ